MESFFHTLNVESSIREDGKPQGGQKRPVRVHPGLLQSPSDPLSPALRAPEQAEKFGLSPCPQKREGHEPRNNRYGAYIGQLEAKSEITGRVFEIVAEIGQILGEDDPIIIVEAMKIEIAVGAPKAGVLREIRVAVEDSVEEGQVVAVLSAS